MASYSQANRFMALTTPLGENVLLLSGFQGREALSELFSYRLDLLADRQTSIAFDRIVGQAVTVRVAVPDGSQRYINGIVRRFRRLGRDEQLAHFEAEIVPQLWLSTKKVTSRIFQQKSVPDILKTIFQGLENTRYELTGSYPQRDFVVQYRESDFAFASRLMEDEGICYFFKHSDGKHQLIVTDSPALFAEAPWPGTVVFDPEKRPETRIRRWEKSQEIRAGSVTLDDYSFELPQKDLRVNQAITDGVQAGTVQHSLRLANSDLDLYHYPSGFAEHFDGIAPSGSAQADEMSKVFPEGKRIAKLRMEEEATSALTIDGESNCMTFYAGARFTLNRHDDGDGEYLLTAVEHEAKIKGNFRSGQFDELDYSNRFRCVPKTLAYRPARVTARPQISGPQTAVVTGPSGQNVFLDKYGRVKVHFHWDHTGPTDSGSSCWVRVGQIWAGNRFGGFFWPRPGHEVIVEFEEGNPDRPVIVGSVYNAGNMPPFELPNGSSATGIKSCSLGGDSMRDYNWLVFHDAADDEHVHLHSENHEIITCEAARHRYTPGPYSHAMGVSPFAKWGSGGGGGASFSIGSGSGGGLLDVLDLWEATDGNEPDWLEKFGALTPASSSFAFGSTFGAVVLGDQTYHTVGGAQVNFNFDPEGIIMDATPAGVGVALRTICFVAGAAAGGATSAATALAGLATALAPGVDGVYSLTVGPMTNLNYIGSELNVTRGEQYGYTSQSFWSDWSLVGVGVKALTLLITVGATTADICGSIFSGSNNSGGVEWATICSRIFVQRLMGLLRTLEEHNAIAEAAAAKAAETLDMVEEITKLMASADANALKLSEALVDASSKKSGTTIDLVKRGLALLGGNVDMLEQDVGRADRVYTSDYSITAKDISLISTAENQPPTNITDATTINITAKGGANNGTVRIQGSEQVSLSAYQGAMTVGLIADGPLNGNIGITNTKFGNITLTQGVGPEAPTIQLNADPAPPTITSSVGLPDVGSSVTIGLTSVKLASGPTCSIEVSATSGITLTYAAWSMTMNSTGISMSVGPNTFKVGASSIELAGLLIKLVAQLESQGQAVSWKLNAQALQQVQAALTQEG